MYMELLPHNTYKLLKKINNIQKADVNKLIEKYGETTEYRIAELYDLGYIRYSRNYRDILFITARGKAYLEDHIQFVCLEINKTLKSSIIYPIIVALITSVLINTWLMSLLH